MQSFASKSVRIGIDVGGTFTDFTVLSTAEVSLHHFKVPSTPHDPSIAIHDGLQRVFEAGYRPDSVEYIGHGTTVATNIIIERQGTLTGLITTKGQRDVLEIARQQRPHLYDYSVQRPKPLVDRRLRVEIEERIAADGTVIAPLNEDDVRKAAELLRSAGVRAVAICFIHAYRYAQHEQRAGKLLRELLPHIPISLSSDVQPEFREFERFSTTVMNSYLTPKMSAYLDSLQHRCNDLSVPVRPYTVHSNGGLMSLKTAHEFPVRTCLSGPAAGVVGGALVADVAGFKNVITYDVGGTSTDVSLVVNGQIAYTPLREVAGYPIRCPMIDVHVIGAGGGSIAWIDSAGGLKVGPQSTAAVPGPAGYGKGGLEATLTDANIILGRLNPISLLDGTLPIDSAASREAAGKLADQVSATTEATADGIVRIAVANMARAIRSISVERGCDLRDYVLVAFGGAGPLHAALVADETGINRVLVPVSPGTMCARGVLLSNISRTFVCTIISTLSEAVWERTLSEVARLRSEAKAWLVSENVTESKQHFRRIIEARYVGQNHEVRVETKTDLIEDFIQAFHSNNRDIYGYDITDRTIEIVNIRIEAIGATNYEITEETPVRGLLRDALIEKRQVDFGREYGGRVLASVYRRSALPSSARLAGPSIIEELSSTIVVPPGWMARIDRFRNIILEKA
jgi:N-methylhydantoinase A